MTRLIRIPRGLKLNKKGKLEKVQTYRDASAAIRAKKSKKQRVVRRVPE